VVTGIVFKGPAFVCNPAVIEFKDFTVNKAHHKMVTLTNVSLAFNRFKVRENDGGGGRGPSIDASYTYYLLNPRLYPLQCGNNS